MSNSSTFFLDHSPDIALLAKLADDVDVVSGLTHLVRENDILMRHHFDCFDFVAEKHVLDVSLVTLGVDDLDSDGFLGGQVGSCMRRTNYPGRPAK